METPTHTPKGTSPLYKSISLEDLSRVRTSSSIPKIFNWNLPPVGFDRGGRTDPRSNRTWGILSHLYELHKDHSPPPLTPGRYLFNSLYFGLSIPLDCYVDPDRLVTFTKTNRRKIWPGFNGHFWTIFDVERETRVHPVIPFHGRDVNLTSSVRWKQKEIKEFIQGKGHGAPETCVAKRRTLRKGWWKQTNEDEWDSTVDLTVKEFFWEGLKVLGVEGFSKLKRTLRKYWGINNINTKR